MSESRKRPLPSSSDLSVPPNKKLPKSSVKEQKERMEMLRQRSALESKVPFCLQPRIPFAFPAVIQPGSSLNPYTSGQNFYPYLPTPSPASSSKSYSVSNLIGDKTPKPSPRYSLSTSDTPKQTQTFPPAWSPLQAGLIGLPTPPSNEPVSITNSIPNTLSTPMDSYSINNGDSQRVSSVSDGKRETTSNSASNIPHVLSPYPSRITAAGSPYFYMYNSPVSPMVLLGSPSAPSSVKSIPSVGSSSGCSSMSESSLSSVEKFKPVPPRIAPTEYHVGIRPPLQSMTVIDEGNNSDGVNSPAPPTPTGSDDEITDIDVEELDSGPNVRCSAISYGEVSNWRQPLINGTSTSTTFNKYQPYSVESLLSTKFEANTTNPAIINHSNVSSPNSSRSSTPEPPSCVGLEEQDSKVTFTTVGNGDNVFCQVPGRLSLLSATQKYKVSVDEVRRRLSNPECLNASVLGGILRRAKSKNGGHHLRQRLEESGLSLPPGRRKATEITLFTSLVEGEATHLANDHRRICQNFFPHQELAQIIGRQHANTTQVKDRIQMVDGARVLLSEFQQMVDAVSKPSNLQPNDPTNPYPGLTNFNLISHGFGNPSISTAISVLQNYLQELKKIYVYSGNTSQLYNMNLMKQEPNEM